MIMMDSELLSILRCPETHQPVRAAEPALVGQLNRQAGSGMLHNHAGQLVNEKMDGGLVRSDGKFCYPIRRDIPVMLVEEAIPLAG